MAVVIPPKVDVETGFIPPAQQPFQFGWQRDGNGGINPIVGGKDVVKRLIEYMCQPRFAERFKDKITRDAPHRRGENFEGFTLQEAFLCGDDTPSSITSCRCAQNLK